MRVKLKFPYLCGIPSITTLCISEQALLQNPENRSFYGASSSRFHRPGGDSFVSCLTKYIV